MHTICPTVPLSETNTLASPKIEQNYIDLPTSSFIALNDSTQSIISVTSHHINDSFPPNCIKTKSNKNVTNYTLSLLNWIPVKDDLLEPPEPFGGPLDDIDPTITVCIIVQNPQYSLQLRRLNSEIYKTIKNLQHLQAAVFGASSANINWCNTSNTQAFKDSFTRSYNHIHISLMSSNIGNHSLYKNYHNLPGGAAIVSMDQWATRVQYMQSNPRGHRTYTTTT
jgi:hypothetical protein